MLKELRVLSLASVLVLAGCHSGQNPLKTQPQQKVFSFLVKAGKHAREQLNIHPFSIMSLYKECIINPEHFGSPRVSGKVICHKIQQSMAQYGQTKTKAFANITIADLQDRAVFKKIDVPFTHYFYQQTLAQ